MATDTLTIAEKLEAPGDGAFGAAQARRLAHALAIVSDDKRLKEVEVKVGVLTWIVGLQLAATLGVLWIVVGTSAQVARLDQRVTGLEQRVDAVEQRLTVVEQRLTGVEQRLGAVEQRMMAVEQLLGSINGKLDQLLPRP